MSDGICYNCKEKKNLTKVCRDPLQGTSCNQVGIPDSARLGGFVCEECYWKYHSNKGLDTYKPQPHSNKPWWETPLE